MKVHLDRRLTNSSPGVSASFDGTNTVFTLPYALSTDVAEQQSTLVLVRQDTGAVHTLSFTGSETYTASVAGNFIDVPAFIGFVVPSTFTFSVIYPRNRETGIPELRGRLNLRYIKLYFENTQGFTVTVSSPGRETRTYSYSSATEASGIFSVPIQRQNTKTTITVTSVNHLPLALSGYEWEGVFHARAGGGRG